MYFAFGLPGAATNAGSCGVADDASSSSSTSNIVSPVLAASAPALATSFALAARAAMVHLGHMSASAGVAAGVVVSMPARLARKRTEWGLVGDAVHRAERLAYAADAEVLCDLAVVRGVGADGYIDFDPVPHASGDDTARPRNLSEGALDCILAVAMGKRFGNSARGADGMAQVTGMSTVLGKMELRERGS